MKHLFVVTSFLLFAASPSLAQVDCAALKGTPISSLSAGFEAWKVVTDAMAACGDLTAELDQEFSEKQPAALAANPSQYTIAGVANETLVPLLADGLIRPLDDLVEKYGQNLAPNQLIEIDGNIMAIAMMVNAQHLMYRSDIFEELGLQVPTTYAEVLTAAQAIKDAGVVDYPLGGTYKAGWNLGEEFVNMYLGFGGTFFNEDNTPAINNEQGIATLEMMKALTEYMNPEYLTADSTVVQQQLQQGEVAMANLWASRAGAMDNAEESEVVGKIEFAAAPAAVEGGAPATTLWWDGMTIAKNVTDEEAEAAFQLMMHGLSYESLSAFPDAAIWLSSQPIESRIAKGALASAEAGAPSYPASSAMGLMHTALGDNIADFLTGAESAEQSLADAEAAYLAAAKEAGLVN
jgi:multiple sugar transport system substrate-binding protein